LVGLLWCSTMWMIGRYRFAGWVRWSQSSHAFAFTLRDDGLCPLCRVFPRRNGFTCGQVILVKHGLHTFSGHAGLTHGMAHVEQASVLGVFYPFVYFATWASMKLVCPHVDAIYDHPLEADARRRQKAIDEEMRRGTK
jgi:hypothetical protein